jgi:DNA polymerase-3 subunit epsilon
VQKLTGISNEMAQAAPVFQELAETVNAITRNSIIVAHNAKADYSFVQTAFQQTGEHFERERLCTLQLSRELMPGMDSYSLGKLCRSLNIPLPGHHRAVHDAKATVSLFERLLSIDKQRVLRAKRKR